MYAQLYACAPVVDGVPGCVVFVCDLFDPPGVISRILPKEMTGKLIEGCYGGLPSTQVLEERLQSNHHKYLVESPIMLIMWKMTELYLPLWRAPLCNTALLPYLFMYNVFYIMLL